MRFDRRSEDWVVLGKARRGGDDGELVLMPEELSSVAATDVRNALKSNAEFYDVEYATALIADVPEEYFDEGPYRPVKLILLRGELFAAFTHVMAWPADKDDDAIAMELGRLLSPYVKSFRGSIVSVVPSEWFRAPDVGLDVTLRLPVRGKNVQHAVSVSEGALRLSEAFATGSVARESVADLIRGGAGHLLEGQPEGDWLEAKSQEYDLRTPDGKISLAEAVARFCNAEYGGLIVIGAHTKKVPGQEIIRKVRGVTALPGRAARYWQVLNEHLYPPPTGMRIEQLDAADGRFLILIDIPAQPEESKPFLVHGALRPDGEVEGRFISIVRRRGEGSIPITAPMIHAMLAAGRAVLRGSYGGGTNATDPTPDADD